MILQQDIEDDLTPDGLDKENTVVSTFLLEHLNMELYWGLSTSQSFSSFFKILLFVKGE